MSDMAYQDLRMKELSLASVASRLCLGIGLEVDSMLVAVAAVVVVVVGLTEPVMTVMKPSGCQCVSFLTGTKGGTTYDVGLARPVLGIGRSLQE